MKVTKSVVTELDLAKAQISTSYFDRTNLKARIEKYYVDKIPTDATGQYLKFENGILRLTHMLERVMCVQFTWESMAFGINVFVYDGHEVGGDWVVSVQPWSGVYDMSDMEKMLITARAKQEALAAETKDGYMTKHTRFFKERPWLQLDGLTPEAAIKQLTELGW